MTLNSVTQNESTEGKPECQTGFTFGFVNNTKTYEECLTVRKHTNLPFVIDESVTDLQSLVKAWLDHTADVVNIKISKFGGITRAKEAVEFCTNVGMEHGAWWTRQSAECGMWSAELGWQQNSLNSPTAHPRVSGQQVPGGKSLKVAGECSPGSPTTHKHPPPGCFLGG